MNSFNFDKDDETKITYEGLKTKLRSSKPKSAPRGSEKLEAFLIEIERKLLNEFDNLKPIKLSERAKRINELQKKLKDTEDVIVPTDKTNSFRIINSKTKKLWF